MSNNPELLACGSTPSTDKHHDVHDSVQQFVPRRGFLKRTIAIGGLTAASTSAIVAIDTDEAFAQNASRVSLAQQMRLVQRHENDHVQILLQALGGMARPKPTFQNLNVSNIAQFLSLGRAFENTGVGAYLGAAPRIFDRTVLGVAGSFALVEARHAGMFNSLQSRAMTENVFDQELSTERALSAAEINNIVAPYVASLNGGPPLAFSDTPSANNDIAILNFALALEYLEAEYYNLNVPRFYP